MDLQRILATLDQPGLSPALGGLKPRLTFHYFENLTSTNTQAWALIDEGAAAGTVVLAGQQTAGRGQWSREWTSLPGGLYLSLVLEPELPLTDGIWLTLASAWGVVAALNTLSIPVQIKWPNDLVIAGQKLGGILTETRTSANALSIAVVGVGINWSNPVSSPGIALASWLQSASTSSQAQKPAGGLETLEDLIAISLRGILQGVYTWQRQGNSALCQFYQDHLVNMGQLITLDGHPAQVIGVSEQGTLKVVLQTPESKLIRELRPGEIQLGYGR
ncbi:MAG: biotin--[acetyl-CoA-carboxylase] ligase [Leptolyngbyaceae cyanobacterium]